MDVAEFPAHVGYFHNSDTDSGNGVFNSHREISESIRSECRNYENSPHVLLEIVPVSAPFAVKEMSARVKSPELVFSLITTIEERPSWFIEIAPVPLPPAGAVIVLPEIVGFKIALSEETRRMAVSVCSEKTLSARVSAICELPERVAETPKVLGVAICAVNKLEFKES